MGGKSKKVTTGYWYKMDVLMTLCHKVDEVVEIRAADRTAWLGSVTFSKTLGILKSSLFGGEKREGGLEGMVDVMMGEDDMEFNSFLGSSMRNAGISGPVPTYRGLLSLFFRGPVAVHSEFPMPTIFQRVFDRPNSITDVFDQAKPMTTSFAWSAMNPYFKPLKVRVRRHSDWYAEKSKIITELTTEPEYIFLTSINQNAYDDYNVLRSPIFIGNGVINTGPKKVRITYNQNGTYDAWSPWTNDPWRNTVAIIRDSGSLEQYWPGYFTTPALAESNAVANPITFTVNSHFEIGLYDSPFNDNRGGISVNIELADVVADMNPAHIIRECLVNPDYGMGYPEADIDDTRLRAVADQLYDENFGLSFKWDQNMEIQEFMRIVLTHIGGVFNQDRTTGKLFIKLIRNDYSIPSLVEFNESNCIVESFTRASSADIVNEITVRYTTVSGEVDAVTVQDLAGISSQGQIISQELDFLGIKNPALAVRVAQRELENRIKPVARLTIRANRSAFKLYEGDVFKLVWPQLNITQMICRILKMDIGSLQEGFITIEAVEDIFGFPESSYLVPQYSDIPVISYDAQPSPVRYITETPYYDLARTLSPADLDYLTDIDTTLDVFAKAPNANYVDYSLWTASSPNVVEERNKSAHPATATIFGGLGKTEISVLTLSDVESVVEQLDSENNYGIINGEYVGITGYDIENSTITVNRGALDTLPVAHAPGSTFFIGNDAAQDDVNYVTGETVLVRVQTFTPSSNLVIDVAPEDSYTMLGRQGRPYPPGKLRINSLVYPTNIGLTDGLSLTWAHRNRLTQTAGIIPQSDNSITPEVGNTYNLRIYGNSDILLRNVTGLTSTSYNYDTVTELADLGGTKEQYWSSVALLLNMNGANGSTTFTDSSFSPKTVTANGNAQISTTQSRFGGASALFDGTGDYLSCAHSTDYSIQAGDFTIEMWIYRAATGVTHNLLSKRPSGVIFNGWGLRINSTNLVQFFHTGGSSLISNSVVPSGQWFHLAVVRNGTTVTHYINGIADGSATFSNGTENTADTLKIGVDHVLSSGFNGYIDDLRITKNVARYTANFTPPAQQLGQYVNVAPSLNSQLRFELEAQRDGLVSWQKHNHTVYRYVYSASVTVRSTMTATLGP